MSGQTYVNSYAAKAEAARGSRDPAAAEPEPRSSGRLVAGHAAVGLSWLDGRPLVRDPRGEPAERKPYPSKAIFGHRWGFHLISPRTRGSTVSLSPRSRGTSSCGRRLYGLYWHMSRYIMAINAAKGLLIHLSWLSRAPARCRTRLLPAW